MCKLRYEVRLGAGPHGVLPRHNAAKPTLEGGHTVLAFSSKKILVHIVNMFFLSTLDLRVAAIADGGQDVMVFVFDHSPLTWSQSNVVICYEIYTVHCYYPNTRHIQATI